MRTVSAGSMGVEVLAHAGSRVRFRHDGVEHTAFAVVHGREVALDLGEGLLTIREASPWPAEADRDDPRRVLSPVAGTLLRLDVEVGSEVAEGQALGIVEAMKMETRLLAARSGTVTAVHAAAGQQVEADALVIEIDVEGAE